MDLRTLWKVKKVEKQLCDWGVLGVSNEGYLLAAGRIWFSLCQFRDNILFASNLPPAARPQVVQMVTDMHSDIWDVGVLCPCVVAGDLICKGACLSEALGICMTVGGGV